VPNITDGSATITTSGAGLLIYFMGPPDENRAQSGRVRTHYDNLKVARDAPIEVIRAAYRVLSAKYHPDHNPGNDQAARAMKIINSAYEVLSDPESRHQHDQWIATVESGPIESVPPSTYVPPPPAPPTQPRKPSESASARSPSEIRERRAMKTNAIKFMAAFVLALAVGAVLGIFMHSTTPANSPISGGGSIPTRVMVPAPVSELPPVHPRYMRPSLDPNGRPWPLVSSYITLQAVNPDDLSSLTVDNRQNTSDMLVKLFHRTSGHAIAVRVFFLRAHEQFTLANVAAGAYDIRYQDLDSGVISKSQPFNLEQIEQSDGSVQYSVTSLTLFVVSNGNTRSEIIGPDEF